MNWFRENRFLGTFLILFGLCTLGAVWFLFSAKSKFARTTEEFTQTAAELNRLQRLNPFPNDANLLTMKAQAADYGVTLEKLKSQLKARVLPVTPMAPNEFQTRLRQAVTGTVEKARTSKVKLPKNFFLGFEEFRATLPNNAAAPLLGQQLAQVELLTNILIDARIDALTAFRIGPLPEQRAAAPTPTPARGRRSRANSATGPNLVERSVVEASFVSTPSAARRVLNQVASTSQQLFIVRTLHVVNEKDKGPPRVQRADTTNPASRSPSPGAKPGAALTFIVGTEHIQISANIELVRFMF
jgi:hypothetical protein